MRLSGFALAIILFTLTAIPASASELRGVITFNGLPVPGASIAATRDGKTFHAVTDADGTYRFADLADGSWALSIEMFGFATLHEQVIVSPAGTPNHWELSSLNLNEIEKHVRATSLSSEPAVQSNMPSTPQSNETPESAQDKSGADLPFGSESGLLVNGSISNAATSNFRLPGAFGSNRANGHGLYNFSLSTQEQNSALDARSYSQAGSENLKPDYNNLTSTVTLGGPLRIPHLLSNGPNFFVQYTWQRNSTATTSSVLVPDAAERSGDFSNQTTATGQPIVVYDPATGEPYAHDSVPISPQAQALLSLYPLPNVTDNPNYNFQLPTLNSTHVDADGLRLNKNFGMKNQFSGYYNFSSTRSSSNNLFGFTDTARILGLNSNVNWLHSFNQRLRINFIYNFSRLATTDIPYWANRSNVSGNAGIQGNSQAPIDWGPPTLTFAGNSGIAALSDANSTHNRNETNMVTAILSWNHFDHNLTFGGDFRRQEFNYFQQSNPRGTFTFTGTATANSSDPGSGSDFADFLIGIPDASTISYGNADKYLRESVYDAYANDDWRVSPGLTVNAGVRWEYSAPITELKDRLVNLDIAPGFTEATPVLASNSVGSVTGQHYPNSLLRPYRLGVEPRLGLAWRPLGDTSLVVRAGYGINYDTSIYQSLYSQLAQQSPLSNSLSVENSAACPLTLGNGFSTCPTTTANTFAVDPDLKVGNLQTWTLEVQRDLPWAMQMSATYLGNKGTHGMQKFYPNSYAPGGVNSCPSCPVGFAYITSGGNSTRESGQLQLRRRLHNGFTAQATYTFSKSIDDDAVLGGQNGGSDSLPAAQDWRNLPGERGLSTNDQRHLLAASLQYTTGMGIGGGTLLDGWRGTLLKEWTALVSITTGSGLPLTPYTSDIIGGTGAQGSIRPNLTGAPIYATSSSFYLNPAAYTAPSAGQYGDARRDSITGPYQFSMNASMSRTFRLPNRWNLDFQAKANNVLNHVAYGAYITNITSTQFGLPTLPNAMRTLQVSARLRY